MRLARQKPAIVQVPHKTEARLLQRRRDRLPEPIRLGLPRFAVTGDDVPQGLKLLTRPGCKQVTFVVDVGLSLVRLGHLLQCPDERLLAALQKPQVLLYMLPRGC